jgi:hypothetical protein
MVISFDELKAPFSNRGRNQEKLLVRAAAAREGKFFSFPDKLLAQ